MKSHILTFPLLALALAAGPILSTCAGNLSAQNIIRVIRLQTDSPSSRVVSQAQRRWQDIIHDAHLSNIKNAFTNIDLVNNKLRPGKYGYNELGRLKGLLSSKALPVNKPELIGNWRCKKIIVDDSGIFSYPYFGCRIRNQNNSIFFEKTSGSQRVSGNLYADSQHQYVLLGAATVNDEPQKLYSGLVKQVAKEVSTDDAVGILRKQGKGKMLLIINPTDSSYEVFELIR